MNNKLRQRLRALGVVMMVYGIMGILAFIINSIPNSWWPNIIAGTVTIGATSIIYLMALDFIKWREENNK